MECPYIQTLIHEAFERPLLPDEQRRLDRHIETCAPCRADAVLLRAVVQAMEEAPDLQPAQDFTLKVMERLPAPVLIFGRIPVVAFRVVAAALSVIAGALGWIYRAPLAAFVQRFPSTVAESAEDSAITAALELSAASIRATWTRMMDYAPVSFFPDVDRVMPLVSVLIAVGVAHVIVKIVEGFEPGEIESLYH